MSTTDNQMALEPDRLNPTDVAILDELADGRATPAFIAEVNGYSTGNVRNRMTNLKDHGHVESLGAGLYRVVDDPREDGAAVYQAGSEEPVDTLDDTVDVEEIKDERDRLEEALTACREQLQQARAEGGPALDDQQIADLEDAHERAVSAQEGREADPSVLADIEGYLERVLEGIDA